MLGGASKCWGGGGCKTCWGCTNEVGGCAPPRKSASVSMLRDKNSYFALFTKYRIATARAWPEGEQKHLFCPELLKKSFYLTSCGVDLNRMKSLSYTSSAPFAILRENAGKRFCCMLEHTTAP